ncbi:hypothetical protein HAX54_004662 [Datura stramonium]|uniref:Uncharacterized protein n=1 Tax=Datura stramonium TaxID=4076 RepID=A0ABS8T7C9_DATST|nr:hypothetical protein [Datura stramonium]
MDLSMEIDLNIPAVGPALPIVDRSPPDDWWVGDSLSGSVVAEEIHVSEQPSDRVIHNLDDTHHGDLYLTPPIYTYHHTRTLPYRWVVSSPYLPLAFPPNSLMPSIANIALMHFS